MTEKKLYSPPELLEKLQREHSESHVYRGEHGVFPPPLWPSRYRQCFHSERSLSVSPNRVIRSVGRQFFFRSDFMHDPSFGTNPTRYEELIKTAQAKDTCKAYIRNALGYVLAETMFQQAGWTSEGIDVTYDPVVAMTFALAISWEDAIPHFAPRPSPAVIYRYRAPVQSWTFDDLRMINYFSCPSLIPTREICRLFRTGSDGEFRESLREYQRAIKWNMMDFDLGEIQGKRPFEVIRIPHSWATNSRIERQHAALLLPDTVRSDALRDIVKRGSLGMMTADAVDINRRRLSVLDCLGYGAFVEDVSARAGFERFHLDISKSHHIDDIVSILRRDILPRADASFDLLTNWLRPFFRPSTAYGTLPVPFDVSGDFQMDVEVLWNLLGDREPERQFCH